MKLIMNELIERKIQIDSNEKEIHKNQDGKYDCDVHFYLEFLSLFVVFVVLKTFLNIVEGVDSERWDKDMTCQQYPCVDVWREIVRSQRHPSSDHVRVEDSLLMFGDWPGRKFLHLLRTLRYDFVGTKLILWTRLLLLLVSSLLLFVVIGVYRVAFGSFVWLFTLRAAWVNLGSLVQTLPAEHVSTLRQNWELGIFVARQTFEGLFANLIQFVLLDQGIFLSFHSIKFLYKV